MNDSMYEPEDTMIDAKCVCCHRNIRVAYDEVEVCESCRELRHRYVEELEGLEAEIERLKAELAKFHECNESAGCHDDEGMVHTLRVTPGTSLGEPLRVRTVYHKEGE